MKKSTHARAAFLATLVLAVAAGTASAQDYTITQTSNRYVQPDANAVNLSISSSDDSGTMTDMPFEFPYYGATYDSVWVGTNGYCQFGGGASTFYNYQNYTFPLPNSTEDGMVAPLLDDLNPGASTSAYVRTWTSGTSPNRVFYVCWDAVPHFSSTDVYYLQVQFHETSGRIVFAYNTSAGTWTSTYLSYNVGIMAPGTSDTRYVSPVPLITMSTPSTDFQFDPDITSFTGRLLMDKLVVDSSGIGNTIRQSEPMTGLRVELLSGSSVAAAGFCDADGDFVVEGKALNSTQSGTLQAVAGSLACTVRADSLSSPTAFEIQSNVQFGADTDVGTFTFTETNDTGGQFRGPCNIVAVCSAVRNWASSRTSDDISHLEVVYDPLSTLGTSYTAENIGTQASMRIAAAPNGNPDPWDDAVIARTYARHVLGAIAERPGTSYGNAFDAASDAQNAFAEGFGYYMWTVISGQTLVYDGETANRSTARNLENPNPTTTKAANVAAWCAMALVDLVDPANEAHDTVDGTGTDGERVFQVFDSLDAAVTPALFYQQWGDLGLPTSGLATDFIYHGMVPDDPYEPNDTVSSPATLGVVGVRAQNLVLNLYNTDVYRVTVEGATTALNANVTYSRLAYDSEVGLTIRRTDGTLIATGSVQGTNGPLAARTGAIGAGDYLVQVSWISGDAVGAYQLQVFSDLKVIGDPLPPWTVDHFYSAPVSVTGGIPPYILTVEDPFVPPPGLNVNSGALRIQGIPNTPGTYPFLLSARDSADPSNIGSIPYELRINKELQLDFGEYLPFALNVPADLPLKSTGGTKPILLAVSQGTLPTGLDFGTTGDLRIVGTPTIPGSSALKLDAVDVAGSDASTNTTAVVCVRLDGKNVPADLAAGEAACGFWFDALHGSSLTLAAKTSGKFLPTGFQPGSAGAKGPKPAKRLLNPVAVDPDLQTVDNGIIGGKLGSASLKKVILPKTGRYFVVLDAAAGEASQLLGNIKLGLPKKGGDALDDFGSGSAVTVEFGALSGATFSLKAKTTSGGLRAQGLVSPSGRGVAVELTQKGSNFTLTAPIDEDGTWQLLLVGQPGNRGSLSWSYKIQQPKGGVFTAE